MLNYKSILIDKATLTTLVERLKSYVQWAYSQETLTGIFISDVAGNELIESGADPIIVRAGIDLAQPFLSLDKFENNTLSDAVHSKTQVRDWEGSDLVVFVANFYNCRYFFIIFRKNNSF